MNLKIVWHQADGVERITVALRDHDETEWAAVWTGGMPPTYWRVSPIDLDREPVQLRDIPEAARARMTTALADCALRLQMAESIL